MNGCKSVEISPSARLDLLAGFDFYEAQQEGLGEYFTDSLLSDLEGLLIHAGVHVRVRKQVHRALANKFPYAIYYQMQGQEAQVIAILDTRLDPRRIRSALSNRG
jgi:plasmid stabilization system protein ParE